MPRTPSFEVPSSAPQSPSPETDQVQASEFTPEQDTFMLGLLKDAKAAEADENWPKAYKLYKEYKDNLLKIREENAVSSPDLAQRSLEIRKSESARLEAFFGKKIDVPPLPKEITPEMLKKWETMGFELHYLPKMKLDESANYPGWQKKPNYQNVEKPKLAPDFLDLPGGWLLVEAREKPNYQDGNQMYQNDPLAKAIEELRKRKPKIIEDFKHPSSRFNLSPQELENPIVRQALADAIGIDVKNLSLPKYIEFNILGNIHHPEWGETNTSEWFADQYDNGQSRLNGGRSDYGGLPCVAWSNPDSRGDYIGFRVLVRFS